MSVSPSGECRSPRYRSVWSKVRATWMVSHRPSGDRPHTGPVLLLGGLEDECVGLGGIAEAVEVDAAVVVLLGRGDGAWRRVAGVVEPGAVGQPGEIRRPRARNAVGQRDTPDNVEHVQHALLAAVLREPVGQECSVVARIVPIEGGRAGRVERVGIDGHPVGAVGTLAEVQHGLVLAALAPLVEVAAVRGRGHADRPDREQLIEPAANVRTSGDGGEVPLGERVLGLGPGTRLGSVALLEPAVRIGDRLPVERLGGVDGAGGRIGDGLSHPG